MGVTKHGDTISRVLANYFTNLTYDDLSTVNIKAAKRMLRDYFGVIAKGCHTGSGEIAAKMVEQMGGVGESTVIGKGFKVPAASAAFANAISEHSIELDDVDTVALFHFGPPVISAALAAGEKANCRGKELITAIVCGCEMMERLSWALNPALRNRGFHTTPVAGAFGAAVAAGKLLKLTAEELTNALGLAGAQASGLMEMYGDNMQKRFNPGPAARNGIVACLLAKLGYTGADTIFEGERGIFNAFSGEGNLEALLPDYHAPYVLEIEFKRYSCARPIHTAIGAALALRPKVVSNLREINTIKVYRHPVWVNYHTNTQPRSYHEAQVSLPYSVAVALTDGEAFFEQYLRADKMDALSKELIEKMEILPDPDMTSTVACRVEISIHDGTLSYQEDYPKGSVKNPMTDDEEIQKFRKLTAGVIGKEDADILLEKINKIEFLTDMVTITEHLKF